MIGFQDIIKIVDRPIYKKNKYVLMIIIRNDIKNQPSSRYVIAYSTLIHIIISTKSIISILFEFFNKISFIKIFWPKFILKNKYFFVCMVLCMSDSDGLRCKIMPICCRSHLNSEQKRRRKFLTCLPVGLSRILVHLLTQRYMQNNIIGIHTCEVVMYIIIQMLQHFSLSNVVLIFSWRYDNRNYSSVITSCNLYFIGKKKIINE